MLGKTVPYLYWLKVRIGMLAHQGKKEAKRHVLEDRGPKYLIELQNDGYKITSYKALPSKYFPTRMTT